MSSFDRITGLPEGVQQYILQEFAIDAPHSEIAKQLKASGYFEDVSEQSLTMLLTRYYRAMDTAQESTQPQSAEPEGVDPVKELEELARLQKKRVGKALEKEEGMGVPIDSNNKAIAEYTSTLSALQKAQVEKRKFAPKPLSERIKEAMELAEALNNANR